MEERSRLVNFQEILLTGNVVKNIRERERVEKEFKPLKEDVMLIVMRETCEIQR